jgi:hypothetical protein
MARRASSMAVLLHLVQLSTAPGDRIAVAIGTSQLAIPAEQLSEPRPGDVIRFRECSQFINARGSI